MERKTELAVSSSFSAGLSSLYLQKVGGHRTDDDNADAVADDETTADAAAADDDDDDDGDDDDSSRSFSAGGESAVPLRALPPAKGSKRVELLLVELTVACLRCLFRDGVGADRRRRRRRRR